MPVIKCEHGHYYNTAQYEECPVCWELDFGGDEEEKEAEPAPDLGLLAIAFQMGSEEE